MAAKVGTSKGGGKQWKITLKNLPRMQCARAVPVTWLGSGSCQPGLWGWILMNEWINEYYMEFSNILFEFMSSTNMSIYFLIFYFTISDCFSVVCFLLGNSPASEFYMPTFRNNLSVPSSYLPAYEDGTDSVPKRWHITFRSRGITQKKAYNIKNTAKVWNQDSFSSSSYGGEIGYVVSDELQMIWMEAAVA